MKMFSPSIWFLGWKELKNIEVFRSLSNNKQEVKLYDIILLSRVRFWLRPFCSVRWTEVEKN